MSSTNTIPFFLHQSTWLYRWIYYLASGFLFGAAALRAFLIFQDAPFLGLVLLVLAGWLASQVDTNFGHSLNQDASSGKYK